MMTWLSRNGELISEEDFSIHFDNRGFSYGDGFFETMHFDASKCFLWQHHTKRIAYSLHILDLKVPMSFKDELLDTIRKLLKKQDQVESSVRVKVIFSRKSGGLYSPSSNSFDYLIMAKLAEPNLEPISEAAFASDVYVSRASAGLKSISSLGYVRAGIEMKNRKLDELILINEHDEIAEGLYTNLWLISNKKVYTPSLRSGCVRGVYRDFLVDFLAKNGIEVSDDSVISKSQVLDADEVFFTNAFSGIRPCLKIEEESYERSMTLFIREQVQEI